MRMNDLDKRLRNSLGEVIVLIEGDAAKRGYHDYEVSDLRKLRDIVEQESFASLSSDAVFEAFKGIYGAYFGKGEIIVGYEQAGVVDKELVIRLRDELLELSKVLQKGRKSS